MPMTQCVTSVAALTSPRSPRSTQDPQPAFTRHPHPQRTLRLRIMATTHSPGYRQTSYPLTTLNQQFFEISLGVCMSRNDVHRSICGPEYRYIAQTRHELFHVQQIQRLSSTEKSADYADLVSTGVRGLALRGVLHVVHERKRAITSESGHERSAKRRRYG